MTEQDWLACNDPKPMLELLRSSRRGSRRKMRLFRRKLRLFACACCRRIWTVLTVQHCRSGIEMAEQYADGLVPEKMLRSAGGLAGEVAASTGKFVPFDARYDAFRSAAFAVSGTTLDRCDEEEARMVAENVAAAAQKEAMIPLVAQGMERTEAYTRTCDACRAELIAASALLRDIFDNPFGPVAFDPAWQTPTVVAVAQATHENRLLPAGTLEPARLAILADALEEAGCDNAHVLNHCRQPGEHVRGCWAVDLLLGLK